MDDPARVDAVLIQWGDRLFYPANRIVRTRPQPRLSGLQARQRAAQIRARIEAIAVRRAPQVMVKVTGGGRGMKAICAHLRYISKNGRLDIEDERGSDRARQGCRSGAGRRLALRRQLHRRRQRPARGLQHHPVDAARQCRATGGAQRRQRVRQSRAGRSQVRDGAARPPGQPSRTHQCSRRVQERQATESAQGRPAALARNLCREAARLGHRRRCDATLDARCDAQLPAPVASRRRSKRAA